VALQPLIPADRGPRELRRDLRGVLVSFRV
jgi:hypothetical protein